MKSACVLALFTAVSLAVGVASAAADPGGNSAAAHACKGTHGKDAGDCVSQAAQGGTPTAAQSAGQPAVGAAPAAPQAGGNSEAAHECQKGGWQNLVQADQMPFKNTGDCVSYAAHGGTPAAPLPPSLSVSFTPTFDPDFCNVIVSLSHFAPTTQYSVSVSVQDFGITAYGPFPVTTDSSGAGSIGIFSYVQSSSSSSGFTAVDASVGSVSSGFQEVVC